jgi:hypothetical protein
MEGTVNCARREEGRPDFTGTAAGPTVVAGVASNLGGATSVTAGAGGFASTALGLTALAAGALGFEAGGAAAGFLAAVWGVTTLLTGLLFTGVVTVFFAEEGVAFGGDLTADFTGTNGFFAAVVTALALLAATALAFGCGLAATWGLAFLVLVAFNSCLLSVSAQAGPYQ